MVDLRALTKITGLFSFDSGFVSTASWESNITYIDGDQGWLDYRGYPIEQLAEESDYLEVCYLLIYGELPTPEQKAGFDNTVRRDTMVHEQLTLVLPKVPLRRASDGDDGRRGRLTVCVLPRHLGFLQFRSPQIAIYRPISIFLAIAAVCYLYLFGLLVAYPRSNLCCSENLFDMVFARPCEGCRIHGCFGTRARTASYLLQVTTACTQ